MTVTINGTTGIDKVQPGVVTSSSLASGQTLAVNGIAFPAAQSASSDANTLDDYEEGTWTPSFTTGTFTYATRTGFYTKVGNIVNVQIFLATNSATGSGTVTISGLPFANSLRTTGSIYADSYTNVPYGIRIEGSGTEVLLFKSNAGTSPLQVSDFINASGGYNQTYINVTYRVA